MGTPGFVLSDYILWLHSGYEECPVLRCYPRLVRVPLRPSGDSAQGLEVALPARRWCGNLHDVEQLLARRVGMTKRLGKVAVRSSSNVTGAPKEKL